jgi:hypothetical protein
MAFDPYAPGAIMHMTDHGRESPASMPGMSEAAAANLAALHRNPIWRLAWQLGSPKAQGGRGLGANNGVTAPTACSPRRRSTGRSR